MRPNRNMYSGLNRASGEIIRRGRGVRCEVISTTPPLVLTQTVTNVVKICACDNNGTYAGAPQSISELNMHIQYKWKRTH